jgi:hypothetical protein
MNDDTAARTLEEMREFSTLYRRDIGWPFYCMVSPMSLWDKDKAGTPEEVAEGRGKIQALVDAGLTELNAGIQTNGETNFRDYGRLQRDEVLFPVTDMLNEFAKDGRIGLFYDFITFNPRETSEDTRRTLKLIERLKPPFDLVSHTLHIGQRSKMRDWYERYKAEEIANGRPYNKVHEDLVGESDYHDTYLFYDHLADNPNFSLSALIEFMAGLHNDEMTGRIPRYAQDLMSFDVFKDLRIKHSAFAQVLDTVGIPDGMLSMELLALERLEEFFREHRPVFKELYLNLHAQHPIHYSNMRKK